MSTRHCTLEHLAERHDVSAFSSGKGALDDWLRRYAVQNDRMDSTRVFVLLDNDRVVGYFALSMGAVAKDEAPRELVRGLPRYRVSSVLLTKLAVVEDLHGRGYGTRLPICCTRRAACAFRSGLPR